MEVGITDKIVAVITLRDNDYKVGGALPIFYTDTKDELEEISILLARITLGMVHDLGNGVKLVIKH